MNEPGKKFGSTNVEEFLKNIWVAEDSQAVAAATAGTPAQPPSLQRQKSFILPRSLSGKPVHEVWKNIQGQLPNADYTSKLQQQQQPLPPPLQQRQETMGEVTLEDFLLRAGIAREDGDGATPAPSTVAPAALLSNINCAAPDLYPPNLTNGARTSTAVDNLAAPGLQADWMNFPKHQQHQQLVQQAEAAAALAVAKRGVSPFPLMLPGGNPMYDSIPDGAGYGPGSHASLSISPTVSDFSMHGKKRSVTEVVIEKTVERQQKRMIKNRESAARSRARKQAYTVELEAEVSQLKEENARLLQQQALSHQLPETGHPQHSWIRVLRRTRSQ